MKMLTFRLSICCEKQGFDVRFVYEEFPSSEDDFVLHLANTDDRILITSDKDFGELVYRLKKISRGIILLRMEELKPLRKAAILVSVLRERGEQLSNAFVVIGKELVRIRPM